MNLQVGQTLGKYRIDAEIGRGGMGIVYRGYDPVLRRPVAVKVLPPQLTHDTEFVQRFRQEAILAASLRHPGIVTIHDVGQQGDTHYMVMEYLEGETLETWLRRQGPLRVAQAAQIVGQIAAALDYAHSKGVIHRDIKPVNIMLGPDGRVTLMDFGLVRAAEGTSLTRTGQVMGTPEYMAPEQALGEAVDARSDVYALGVVAYRLLSGQVPFSRSTPYATTYAHIHEPPPPLRSVRGDIPATVEAVVGRALAKRPGERYQRAGEFAAALSATLGDNAVSRTLGRSATSRTKEKSVTWLWAVVLTVLVLAVAVGTLVISGRGNEGPQVAVVSSPMPLLWTQAPDQLVPSVVPTTASAPIPSLKPTAAPSTQVPAAPVALTPVPTAAPPTVSPPPTEPPIPVFWVEQGPVNARSGPGTAYAVVAKLQPGQRFPITGRNPTGDWWQFSYNGQSLWVADQVVKTSGYLEGVAQVAVPTLSPPSTASQKPIHLSLLSVANANLKDGYSSAPLGQVTLGGVPFDLKSGETVTTQADTLPNNPTRVWLPAGYNNVTNVYLLMTGGNLYIQYDHQPIGKVRLIFADGRDYTVDLIGGFNIREWKHGKGIITSTISADVTEVWRSNDRYDGSPAIIDLLRIVVPTDLRGRMLEGIEVLDVSTTTAGSLDPAINLLGATLVIEMPASADASASSPRPTSTPLPACTSRPGPTFARVWDRDRMGCPSGSETGILTAYEPFERGWMLWRRDNDGHYALFNDGRFAVYWYPPGEPPNFSCTEAAAAGMPRRGFGRVWCQNLDVRQRIGRALSDEVGDYRPLQTFERGFMVYIKERGTVVSVFDDGTWKEVR